MTNLKRTLACALVMSGLLACSSTSSTNGSTPDGPDAGRQICNPSWPVLDTNKHCLLPLAVAQGLCMSAGPTHYKGVYQICAISPTHEYFWIAASYDSAPRGDGWTFAGAAEYLQTKVVLASADDAALCSAIGGYSPETCE